jgi:hypothetical protein
MLCYGYVKYIRVYERRDLDVLLPTLLLCWKIRFITIDYKHNSIEILLRTSLSDNERKEITDKLYKERIITHLKPDYLYPVHCPWCGIHLKHVIDFDKCARDGQYSSKEGWKR